jgi:hypothetical protein
MNKNMSEPLLNASEEENILLDDDWLIQKKEKKPFIASHPSFIKYKETH